MNLPPTFRAKCIDVFQRSKKASSSLLKSLWRRDDRSWKGHSSRVLLVLAALFAPVIFTLAIIWGNYVSRAKTYDLTEIHEMGERTWVLDRHGKRLGHVSGHGENRQTIELDEISPHFISALLAREDSRFYSHSGVDWFGVIRAAVRNMKEGEIVQGASTLTMQLVRNTFGSREETYRRKLLEAALAIRLESQYSKDEILQAYVNRIYFGSGLYGVERAAQGFFMKPASDLTLGESALLAGIIRAPSAMSPFSDRELAFEQRDQVLNRMVSLGVIEDQTSETEKTKPLFLRPENRRMAEEDYILQTVHGELNRFLPQSLIDRGGLMIYTTIDPTLQKSASLILDQKLTEIESKKGFPHPSRADDKSAERTAWTQYVQGAVVAVENETGDILAMVGGRDFGDSPFNRAMFGARQLGSTFKPFVYAAGFEKGAKPGLLMSDGPISMPGGNGKMWRPQNSDGRFGGYLPVAQGLIRSRNTLTIRVGNGAGVEQVLSLADELKLPGKPPVQSPVSFLGTFEATPVNVAGAFSMFPNKGVYRSPRLIKRIESTDGELLYGEKIREKRVISEEAAWTTSEVLREVIQSGTGASAGRLGYESPAHGKTGTTNDYKDAWFSGYTDKVTCAVWVGMDRPETIMYKGYGSTLALPIWVGVMQEAEKLDWPAEPLTPPAGFQKVSICKECGQKASRSTSTAYTFTLPESMLPANQCVGRHHYSNPSFIPGSNTTSTQKRPVRKAVRTVTKPIRNLGRRLFGR